MLLSTIFYSNQEEFMQPYLGRVNVSRITFHALSLTEERINSW